MTQMSLLKQGSYINGQWLTSSQTIDVFNPATGESISQVFNAVECDVINAVNAAKKSLPVWSAYTAVERANILQCWFRLILENKQQLAELLTLEQGKTLNESLSEIEYGASFIEWFAEEGKRAYGDVVPHSSRNNRSLVIKQPVGVVAAITPWNFPNAMITRKAAAALAAGCTFVVKPSELTPLSALALAELADQAGIPAGVFNVVVTDDAKAAGKILTEHVDVAKFTFTGSTAVGKQLIAQCAGTVKRVSMELGGNAPFIIFDDADIDAAIKGLLAAKFRNAGQTCIAANRIFVQHQILATFTEKLLEAIKTLTLGNGMYEGTDIGPLITKEAVNNIYCLVENALTQGAQLLSGHTMKSTSALGDNYYPVTVLSHVNNTMDVVKEEVFGPVISIIEFDTEPQVLALANDTEYGLSAYFYSQNLSRVWRMSEQLQFGMIGINEAAISNVAAPFGGIKQSGSGREGSQYGLQDYLNIKYLNIGIEP
jgi:succinate-semialdehyde dehydrogenase/glutarate-semialdehyde dehydrogenase